MWVDQRVCVSVDGVALNLLRRPLINVYPYNISVTSYFLRRESVCACLHSCAPYFYMQTDTQVCASTLLRAHVYVCAHPALLFNERE